MADLPDEIWVWPSFQDPPMAGMWAVEQFHFEEEGEPDEATSTLFVCQDIVDALRAELADAKQRIQELTPERSTYNPQDGQWDRPSPEGERLVRELIVATLSKLEQGDEIDALRSFIARTEFRAEEYQATIAALRELMRDRDELWCRAIVERASVYDINRIVGRFNEIRPDQLPEAQSE